MKPFFLRSAIALACALGLAACGGGNDGRLQISVSLVNVTKTGLKLQNNGGTFYDVPPGGVYAFPDLIAIDGSFDVVAQGTPDNATQCEVQNGKAKATNISLQKIRVVCTLKTYELGGTITGLSTTTANDPAKQLILVNGADKKVIPFGTTSTLAFNMTTEGVAGQVPADYRYGVLVLQNPAGQECTVVGGTGIMPAGLVNSIAINCVAK